MRRAECAERVDCRPSPISSAMARAHRFRIFPPSPRNGEVRLISHRLHCRRENLRSIAAFFPR